MEQVDTILHELKMALEQVYGPRLMALYLYGSHARGEARQDSDIDVLIVLDEFESAAGEIIRAGEVVARLSLEHDCVISLLPLRERQWASDETSFTRAVKREARLVA